MKPKSRNNVQFFSKFLLRSTFVIALVPLSAHADYTDLDHGNIESASVPCNSFISSSAVQTLCQIFGCTAKAQCSTKSEELYSGSALKVNATPMTESWNYMGSVGQSLANASVCLLKDLSKGPVVNNATATLLGLQFPIKQTVGFISFDPATKSFKGYQRVQVCGPLVGCFDAKIQGIKAVVNENNPANGGGLNIHDGAMGIPQAFGLVVNEEESDEGFSVKAPAIVIETPYGQVEAQPGMSYSSHMGTTLFTSGDVEVDVGMVTSIPRMANVLGPIGGVVLETLMARPNHGWVSQAGIGSRQASHPNDPIWAGGLSAPRPDIQNMTQARTNDELKPIADFSADVAITYSPPIPDFLTSAPLSTHFDVKVDPKAELRYSSQLESEFSQSYQEIADLGPGDNGRVIFKSRAEALGSFSLQAGVDLNISVSTPFWSGTIVNIVAPQVVIPVASGPGSSEKVFGEAITYPDPHASAANAIYNSPLQKLMASPNSGTPDGSAFVSQCLAQKVASQPVPQPGHTPGNADLFQQNLYYPCNICAGHLEINYPANAAQTQIKSIPAVATILSPDSQGGPTAWKCDPDHVGCFDLCSYNPRTRALTLYENAMQLTAKNTNSKLKGVTSATRPGLACNQPYRPIQ